MENTYYLIVEQQAGGQCLRTIDEYSSADVAAGVHAERASRSEWRQRQAALDRWPARQATMRTRS